jgi:DNA-directed RNA polymerase specialized sigma24 family protein
MEFEEFTRAFDEHHVPLFRFAYRLTGSAADAEDIVQECLNVPAAIIRSFDSPAQAYASQQVLEPRVGAKRVEARPYQD